MAKIPGLNISAPVVPLVDTDTYPSHRAMYGQGGWQEVATIADRDAITAPRREAGMAVYVTSEQRVFILNADLTTWTELKTKSLDSVRKTDTFTNFLPVEEDEIVQYVGETTENYINGYFYTAVSDGEEPPTYTWTQINVQPVTEVINNLTSTSATSALSANMGRVLQEEIEALSGRGRYLTLWNCSTGLAETNPPESPYEYKTGDYFIVGTVASAGGTNYRPDGSSYTIGVASTTVETDEVSVDDTYIYDGSTWHLQYNSQKTVTFTNIDGSPYDNTNLANALNSKVDKTDSVNKVYGTDSEGNQTTYDMTTFGQIDNVAIHGVDQTIVSKRVDLSVVEQVNSLPTASETVVGRVVQYTGADTQTLVHNYFYECKPIYTDETRVVKSASEQLTASADLSTFAQSGLAYNTPYLYEKHGAYWDCIDPEGVTITGPRAGLVLSGVVNTNDQVILQVDREFVWEQVNVQPETVLEWGNIGGTLSNQTDLQNALDSKQDVLTAGTNITIEEDSQTGDLVISSTAQESFFRGNWGSWSNVPSDANLYPVDYKGNKTPTYSDFLIVKNASDYAGDFIESIEIKHGDLWKYVNVTINGVTTKVDIVEGDNYFFNNMFWIRTEGIVFEASLYSNYITKYGNTVHPAGTKIFTCPAREGVTLRKVYYQAPILGTWRFAYYGTWNEDGKNGWKPEYQVEDVLPIATDTVAGITKIYSATGQNTDGSMTQKSITDAINRIQDSCYRGDWDTWADVPVSANLYPEDYKYSHTPTWNDYMVVNDASGYVPSDLLTVELIVVEMTNNTCRYTIGADSYTKTRQSGQNAPFGPNNEMSWNTQGMGTEGTGITFNDQVKYQDHVYNSGESIRLANEPGSYSVADLPKSFFIKRHVDSFEGAWRFSYQGVWATDGKSGWKDEYQIESTLPDATDSVKGIAKLYTTTGQNTDGSVTQKLVTDELGKKQDTLTAGTGISIDANNVISSTSSESFYRGTFATWSLVPTNTTNYVEDPIHHLKTPTNTDYMIVTDASDYYKPGAEITIQARGYVGGIGYVLELSGKWSDSLIAYNTPYERVYGNNELIVKFEANGYWGWRITFNTPVVLNGVRYDNYDVWTFGQEGWTRVFNEIVDQPCEGTWRFGYYGEWDTAGRNGWVAEYKIEDTLPIATDTEPGIAKLYTTTGSNTDGAVDQATVTTELAKKVDKVSTASQIYGTDSNGDQTTYDAMSSISNAEIDEMWS